MRPPELTGEMCLRGSLPGQTSGPAGGPAGERGPTRLPPRQAATVRRSPANRRMGRSAAQLGRGVRRLCCRHLGRWPDSSWPRQLAVVTARSRSLLEVDANGVQRSFDVGHRRRWWHREEGRPQSAEDLWQRDGRGPGVFPRAGVIEAKAIGEPGDLADEVVGMRLPVPGVESKTVSCSCYLVMCLHRGRLG